MVLLSISQWYTTFPQLVLAKTCSIPQAIYPMLYLVVGWYHGKCFTFSGIHVNKKKRGKHIWSPTGCINVSKGQVYVQSIHHILLTTICSYFIYLYRSMNIICIMFPWNIPIIPNQKLYSGISNNLMDPILPILSILPY